MWLVRELTSYFWVWKMFSAAFFSLQLLCRYGCLGRELIKGWGREKSPSYPWSGSVGRTQRGWRIGRYQVIEVQAWGNRDVREDGPASPSCSDCLWEQLGCHRVCVCPGCVPCTTGGKRALWLSVQVALGCSQLTQGFMDQERAFLSRNDLLTIPCLSNN